MTDLETSEADMRIAVLMMMSAGLDVRRIAEALKVQESEVKRLLMMELPNAKADA